MFHYGKLIGPTNIIKVESYFNIQKDYVRKN
ncbi:MAG: hypothetical protein ACI88L_000035 [Candidatus Paceibacteria bacterium]|jgi:hypothetical protein